MTQRCECHRGSLSWLVSSTLAASCLVACRTTGDFRVRVAPEPVPRCARTGAAHFLTEVRSLARIAVRVGAAGPLLEPGGRLRLPRDLPAGRDVDRIELFAEDGGRVAEILYRVPSFLPVPDEEPLFPLPDLGGWPVRVTAGFHAPNHREPGRRYALDLVPRVPEGRAIFGVAVRSPFAGRVLGVTTTRPDRPGGQPNELLVEADDGRIWRFAHFQRNTITLLPEQTFEKGDLLGRIGLSGSTTGPHLHMELVERGKRPRRR